MRFYPLTICSGIYLILILTIDCLSIVSLIESVEIFLLGVKVVKSRNCLLLVPLWPSFPVLTKTFFLLKLFSQLWQTAAHTCCLIKVCLFVRLLVMAFGAWLCFYTLHALGIQIPFKAILFFLDTIFSLSHLFIEFAGGISTFVTFLLKAISARSRSSRTRLPGVALRLRAFAIDGIQCSSSLIASSNIQRLGECLSKLKLIFVLNMIEYSAQRLCIYLLKSSHAANARIHFFDLTLHLEKTLCTYWGEAASRLLFFFNWNFV